MPIQSIATAHEENSPFYKANKEICLEFDRFIIKNGGQTRGTYGAAAYFVRGKIPHPYQWEFQIKKSTFTLNRKPVTFQQIPNVVCYEQMDSPKHSNRLSFLSHTQKKIAGFLPHSLESQMVKIARFG